jgi:hypothetical protein
MKKYGYAGEMESQKSGSGIQSKKVSWGKKPLAPTGFHSEKNDLADMR